MRAGVEYVHLFVSWLLVPKPCVSEFEIACTIHVRKGRYLEDGVEDGAVVGVDDVGAQSSELHVGYAFCNVAPHVVYMPIR